MLSKLTWPVVAMLGIIFAAGIGLAVLNLPKEASAVIFIGIGIGALFTNSKSDPPNDGGAGTLKSGALMLLIIATTLRVLSACSDVNPAADVTTTQK